MRALSMLIATSIVSRFGDRQGVKSHLYDAAPLFAGGVQKPLVISYSLYNADNPRYGDGAIANCKLAPIVYPGWQLWIYHDGHVPPAILQACSKAKLFNMSGDKTDNMRTWRFLPAGNPNVKAFISRDIDSRLSKREKHAVDDWLASNKTFHVMRDHPAHSSYPMNAGMWGSRGGAVKHIEQIAWKVDNSFTADQIFLTNKVWPLARLSVMQHDSFSCDKWEGAIPFPVPRKADEHVGSVFINGKERDYDVAALHGSTPPARCMPPAPCSHQRMLWVIRTYEGRYLSHVALQNSSWMHRLRKGRDTVLLASQMHRDETYAESESRSRRETGIGSALVNQPACSYNDHGLGLCCQELSALQRAATLDFDWVFVIDDDVFAAPDIVWDVARDHCNAGEIGVGTLGCVSKEIVGFCGGGGYLLSKTAVQLVARTSTESYMENCKRTAYCDITTAWALKRGNAKLLTDQRFRPWGLSARDKQQAPELISKREIATLHYYGGEWLFNMSGASEKMKFIAQRFDDALGINNW